MELREMGRPVKARWFIAKGKDIFKRLYLEMIVVHSHGQISYGGFQFSRSWFRGFQRRKLISLRK